MRVKREKKVPRHYGAQSDVARCSFTTAGTSAPTLIDGLGASVARTDVGVFVVTLDEGPCYAIDPHISFEFTTTAQVPLITAHSLTARTVTITVVGAGGSTAAETTGMTIYVSIAVRKSN